VKEGQYQRIRKLQNDIHSLVGTDYHEFQITGLIPFLRRAGHFLNTPPAVQGGRKTVLPVLLPGERHSSHIRAVNHLLGKLCGAIIGLLYRPEYCIGETHRSYSMVSGVKATSMRTRVVFDLHGAYPEEVLYSCGSHQKVKNLVDNIEVQEEKLVRLADLLVSQSDEMFRHLEQKHNLQFKNKVLYQCGVDTKIFNYRADHRLEVRDELALNESDTVLVYLGGLHRWQLVESVFAIFREFAKLRPLKSAKLLVLTGESAQEIMANAERHGIAIDVIRVLSVAHGDVPRYLSACDFGFLLREDTTLNRVACPTKLGEYLACGVPVVTSSIARHWCWTEGESRAVCMVDHEEPAVAATQLLRFLALRGGSIDETTKDACRSLAFRSLSMSQDFNNLSSGLGFFAKRNS
jgi:glycosyltransferase involved in cell wall biosynthesis